MSIVNMCRIPQSPAGGNSKLYMGLKSKFVDNPSLANYIYAVYASSGVAAQMDAAGYSKTLNGEHTVEDVLNFLDVANIQNSAEQSISGAKATIPGATTGLTNSEEAMNKALNFNQHNPGKVAFLVQHDDTFDIIVENKDSRTQERAAELEEQKALWDVVTQEFHNKGFDINTEFDFLRDIANVLNVPSFVSYIESLRSVNNNNLSVQDIEALLTFGKNNSTVQNLVHRYPTDTANTIYNTIHSSINSPASTVSFFNNALTQAKRSIPINTSILKTNLQAASANFIATSKEASVQEKIKELHKKYNINANQFIRNSNEIKKLSEASVDAIMTLERQIRNIEKKVATSQTQKQYNTALGKSLEATQKSLMQELAQKKYYVGLLQFLSQGNSFAATVENRLQQVIGNPVTNMQQSIFDRADIFDTVETLRNNYYVIANALLQIDSLVIDESISDADKDALKTQAKALLDSLNRQKNLVSDLKSDTVGDICKHYLGDQTVNGLSFSQLKTMAEADSSIMDSLLYSVGRQSNPLVAMMGGVIRNAQDERDHKMNEVSLRIRRATNALYEAGHNSEFMYDNTGHIISDRDWKTYEEERSKAIKKIYAKGFKNGWSKFDIKAEIENWEEANTEEIEVDHVNHRMERIPVFKLQNPTDPNMTLEEAIKQGYNPMNLLSQAQKDYYNNMMQIKGELGTLMPNYAQRQFLPAQIRKSWLDILSDAINRKIGAKKAAQILLDKMEFWKIREDDNQYSQNGIIVDDEQYGIIQSDFDNTPLKQIPIFYVNKLHGDKKNRWEAKDVLLKDFSAGLQALAGVALNFDAMNQIHNTVELMASYIEGVQPNAEKGGHKLVDVVEDACIQIIDKVKKDSVAKNTSEILHGFIDVHIYGIRNKDTSLKWRILQGLINYSSIKGLAVNVPGAISNALVGEAQMIIEAVAGSFSKNTSTFTVKDYVKAKGQLLGDPFRQGTIMDLLTNNVSSKAYLLNELFDPTMDNFSEEQHKRYHKSAFRRIFGGFNAMGLYSSGEYLIHTTNMYAMLNHQKVYLNGKKISLYDAFEVVNKLDGNSELQIKAGVTLDAAGTQQITHEFLQDFKRQIRSVNQNCHGSMNAEDKGLIHQNTLGRAVMNFRQWMVEHYSRRWRGKHWDATIDKEVEGYRRTANRFAYNWIKDLFGFQVESAGKWKDLDEVSKQNVIKCFTENALIGILVSLSAMLGDPDKDNQNWWLRMFMYQVNRMKLDEIAATFPGALYESKTVINSPIASVSTVNGLLYPFLGLQDLDKTVQRGRYKGWNKYWKNTLFYTVPFWKNIDQLEHLGDEDTLFYIFDNSRNY